MIEDPSIEVLYHLPHALNHTWNWKNPWQKLKLKIFYNTYVSSVFIVF